MLKKRIIPCLDIKDGRTVKGVNFVDLRDAGDPVELAKAYVEQGADELVFLDITATVEERPTLIALVEKLSLNLSIPFAVGGGIRSVADAKAVLAAGAEKVCINSAAIKRPELINELAEEMGKQAVVVAIDSRFMDGKNVVHIHGGRTATELDTLAWAKEAESRGAGEILLTSMDHDGTKSGFALELTQAVCQVVSIPVIASGGAGLHQHFVDVFEQTPATGALAASIFHFGEIPIPQLKRYLHNQKISVRCL